MGLVRRCWADGKEAMPLSSAEEYPGNRWEQQERAVTDYLERSSVHSVDPAGTDNSSHGYSEMDQLAHQCYLMFSNP